MCAHMFLFSVIYLPVEWSVDLDLVFSQMSALSL